MTAYDLIDETMAELQADPFVDVRVATRKHRAEHGCGAYTYDKGPFLSSLSRKLRPSAVLEMGTALGYTALCLSEGGPDTGVVTIEADPSHVAIARKTIEQFARSSRIEVQQGTFEDVLPKLDGPRDLIFFDGFAPTLEIYNHILRLSRTGSILVSANLTLETGIEQAYRVELDRSGLWDTAYTDSTHETALSIRTGS